MVLSTENNYNINIISLVMMLVAPISGLTMKNCRFSLDPTIACINQHYSKNIIFKLNTVMIPHKTYIPHIPAFVYLVCFLQPKYTAVGPFSLHYFLSSSLLCIILFSVSELIRTLTECFPVYYKYFCKFSIKNIAI